MVSTRNVKQKVESETFFVVYCIFKNFLKASFGRIMQRTRILGINIIRFSNEADLYWQHYIQTHLHQLQGLVATTGSYIFLSAIAEKPHN